MSQKFCFWFASRFSILTRGVQVLSGEDKVDVGQILAIVVVFVALLRLQIATFGERFAYARTWIQVDYLI